MTTAAVNAEIQKLAPSAVIELFQLDAAAFGGGITYFHAGTNGLMQRVTWQGQVYEPFPVQITGFEISGNSQLPRPTLRVANVTGLITALVLAYGDLLGAKVTRKRTMVKFLDAVNFASGTNPTADPTAEFDDDVYFIDRKSAENRDIVEFELAAAVDLAGVMLPRRQIIQNVCPWKYKGTECGWTKSVTKTGTYSRTGFVITATVTAHGLAVGDTIYIDATSGAVTDKTLTIVSVPTANTFTVTDTATGTTSGSLRISNLYSTNDAVVFSTGSDVCGKRLSSCKARFGQFAELPFGGFPAAGLIR